MSKVSRHSGVRRPAWVLRWLLLASFALAVFPAAAARVSLDEVVLPVPDRSPAAREKAVAEGLEILLVRLTGERDVARYAGMRAVLGQPARYLQQFSYETPADRGGGAQLLLRMRFDRPGIERVLRRHGLPIWGEKRPAVVAWIAIDDGRQRTLLADQPENPMVARLHRVAQRRGLPLVLPLMDLQDTRAVRLADVWGGFLDRLGKASLRYEAQPVVLAGRVWRSAGGGWRARWWLRLEGQEAQWDAAAPRLGRLLEEAVEETADRLALRLAIRATGSGERVPVLVTGLRDLAGHLAARRHLLALAPVRGVHVRTLQPDRVVFELDLEGGRQALLRALARDSLFHRVGETPMLHLQAGSLPATTP